MPKLKIRYLYREKYYDYNGDSNEHFQIKSEYKNGRFKADIHVNEKIRIEKLQLIFPYSFNKNQRIFVNGYQSWTDSREYFTDEKMTELTKFNERKIKSRLFKNSGLGRAGDIFYCDYPRKSGLFYGYSYGYVRNEDNVDLFASLSERNGYTIVHFDVTKNQIIAEKDFEGVTFSGKHNLIDFAVISGKYDNVFDDYFEMMNISCRYSQHKSGYTTWYNYYRSVDEKIVIRDLQSLAALPEKVDIFQIDDGYQRSIGDWLHTDEKKFPNGMKYIADEIHKKNMLAGLWLAPFAATKDSFIYKEHKDWLICDDNGELYPAGPNWGTFYAIDFYNKAAAEYIRKVFDTVLNEWGYDMVKLDFLYAACVVPMHNKSRGQIMCEAMDFIRECSGDKLVLGCGVPLMPAFGKIDFCRIGADVGLEWKHRFNSTREDVSTPNTVNCTIFRRHLNGRAFLNDPDVFLLRDNNIRMSLEKRKLLAKINSLFGSLLFVSDNVGDYNDTQLDVFCDTIKDKDIKIISAGFVRKNIVEIEYEENGLSERIVFNVNNGKLC